MASSGEDDDPLADYRDPLVELLPKPNPKGDGFPPQLDLTLEEHESVGSDSEDDFFVLPAAAVSTVGSKRPHPETRAEALYRERRVLSPLEMATKQQIQQHLVRLRAGVIFRYLMPLLQRCLTHTLNRGLFNDPVSEEAYPDYRKVIDKPIDLGIVKQKLQALLYEDELQFANDVRMVFANAVKYNPSGNPVHQNASTLAQEFEQDFTKVMLKAKQKQQQQQHHGHDCDLCRGNECPLCGEKCLKFDPPVLPCSGTCGLNIRRSAVYYMSADGYRFWCQRCFNALPQEVPAPMVTKGAQNQDPVRKRDLVRKTHSASDTGEPWVQCDFCQQWMHQACCLFSLRKNLLAPEPITIHWKCPLCRLADIAAQEQQSMQPPPSPPERLPNVPPPAASEASASSSNPSAASEGRPARLVLAEPPAQPPAASGPDKAPPGPPSTTLLQPGALEPAKSRSSRASPRNRASPKRSTPRSLALMGENFVRGPRDTRASTLPKTHMSNFLEERISGKLVRLGQQSVCASLTVRVVCAHDLKVAVHPLVRQHFVGKGEQQFPEDMKYRSKAVCLFQKLDGIDVCLFSMFVQEYGDECAPPSQRCVYIAYIDSVAYFRPRKVRTVVYHELVAAYMEYVRRRGFNTAHIWSSPPQRGNTYIFWCHPPHQRTPGKERLCAWYHSLLDRALAEHKIVGVTKMFERYFQGVKQPFPPYFEGDFWPTEVERLGLMPLAKRKKLQLRVQLEADKKEEADKKAEAAADAMTAALAGSNPTDATGSANAAGVAAASSSGASANANTPKSEVQLRPDAEMRWLHHTVRDAVADMKEYFLTVHLQYQCDKCGKYIVNDTRWHSEHRSTDLCDVCFHAEKKSQPAAVKSAGYKPTEIILRELASAAGDPDGETLEVGNGSFTSAGKLFLKLCEFRHQFDTLRRAKHSTMLMLQYLHHVADPKVYAYSCDELDGPTSKGKRACFGGSYGAHGDGQQYVLSLYHRGRQRFPWRHDDDGGDEEDFEDLQEGEEEEDLDSFKTDHPDVGRTVKLIWPEDNTFYPAIIVAVGMSSARGGSNTLLHRVEYLEGGEQETVDLAKEQHEWEDASAM